MVDHQKVTDGRSGLKANPSGVKGTTISGKIRMNWKRMKTWRKRREKRRKALAWGNADSGMTVHKKA